MRTRKQVKLKNGIKAKIQIILPLREHIGDAVWDTSRDGDLDSLWENILIASNRVASGHSQFLKKIILRLRAVF